jgi:hypothetical protein
MRAPSDSYCEFPLRLRVSAVILFFFEPRSRRVAEWRSLLDGLPEAYSLVGVSDSAIRGELMTTDVFSLAAR